MINPPYTLRTLDKAFADNFEAMHKLMVYECPECHKRHDKNECWHENVKRTNCVIKPAPKFQRRQERITVHDEVLVYGEPASPGDPPPIIDRKKGPDRELDIYIVESDVLPGGGRCGE